jgi:hypothetical protein
MARTLAVVLYATILDEQNVEAPAVAYALVDPTASFADVLTTLNDWLAAVDNCTDGQIIRTQLEVLPALPDGLKPAALAGSRVEQLGIWQFTATGTAHIESYPVPALSNSSSVTHLSRIVLTGGSPGAALRDLVAGGGTASFAWTNAWQQAIAAFAAALVSFRRAGSALERQSYERV